MRPLLDAHVPSAVARALTRDGIDTETLPGWQGDAYRDAPDHELLAAAHADGRALVTYDCQTMPELLKLWAETGRSHSGVILVDKDAIRQGDVGGLAPSLRKLIRQHGAGTWSDRVVFLRRA